MSWHLAKSFVGPALAHPEDDYFARVLPVCLRSWDGSSGRPMDRITARHALQEVALRNGWAWGAAEDQPLCARRSPLR